MASESEPRGRFPAWWQSGVIYQIYARSFQDPTETVSAISTALHLDRTILSNSALMPSGCPRSSHLQWPTSDMTLPITAVSTRYLEPCRISISCWRRSMARASRSFWISCRTIPPTGIHGLSKVGRQLPVPGATGTSGEIRNPTAVRLTIGSANSVDRPGPSTR